MSGRRRRDDEWGDGRLDAQNDRRDPWADDGVGDWGEPGADPGGDANRSGGYSGGGYAPQGGPTYASPSFQAPSGGDGYGGGPAQRGSSNGYATGGYGGDGRDAGYGAGRDATYQSAGYGRNAGGNSAYDRFAYGAGGQANDPGYGGAAAGGYAGANGRQVGQAFSPEFAPVDNDDADDDPSIGTPRPYGRLSIYTLHEDKTREFDRLAERAAEGVRTAEPDTLVYVIHVVPKAPQQRIIYEIYRDRGAFLSHERQPHIRQFAADRASCVLATNIIDLRLKYAKVAALGTAQESPAAPQASWTPRAEPAPGNDQFAATTQYTPQYSSAQYPAAQSPAAQSPAPQYSQAQGSPAAASFTPAKDYGANNGQIPTVGRAAYTPATAQYGNSGNGAYGASNGQYGAANSNGYANGGSYSSSGYPAANGYQGANSYSGDNGYSDANGYQNANGYSGANGYSNGSSGYPAANGYSNGNGYAGGYSQNGGE
jgi:quinol monooxygenase YgiN